jgi:hypothetical protein
MAVINTTNTTGCVAAAVLAVCLLRGKDLLAIFSLEGTICCFKIMGVNL